MKSVSYNVKIMDLPNEVLVEIIRFLEKSDILELQVTNKRFHSLLKSEILYRSLCKDKWDFKPVFPFRQLVLNPLQLRPYENSFRQMYFLDHKHRYDNYGIVKNTTLRDKESVRNYGAGDPTILERQIIHMIERQAKNMGEEYLNQYFEGMPSENLSLDQCLRFVELGGEVLQLYEVAYYDEENKEEVDSFPKFRYINHQPGGNDDGLVFRKEEETGFCNLYDGTIYDQCGGRVSDCSRFHPIMGNKSDSFWFFCLECLWDGRLGEDFLPKQEVTLIKNVEGMDEYSF